MKKYIKQINFQQLQKIVSLLVILLFITNLAHADDPGLLGDIDADVPLDGGLSLLVVAGVGYGARKMKGRKK